MIKQQIQSYPRLPRRKERSSQRWLTKIRLCEACTAGRGNPAHQDKLKGILS